MNNFEDFDFEGYEVKKLKDFKDKRVSLLTRLLLRFWPQKGLSYLTKDLGMDPEIMEKANDLFSRVKRIDIFPSVSGGRGFQIILDKSTALYFYQDGDHFVFDGSEVGEYEGGDVTIFDHLK